MTDASQVTYDRGQGLTANVQDALRWVTQPDIRNYMVAGESLHISFFRAYNAGARLIHLPPGEYTTTDFLPLNNCLLIGAGAGSTTIRGSNQINPGGAVRLEGTSGVQDLRIHLQTGGGGAITSDNVGSVTNAFVERVVCTRETTAGHDPMIGCVARGAGVDGLTFRDVELINPYGMGFELNAQGDDPARAGLRRLLLSSVTIRNPGSGQTGTNFAPAISLDGFNTAPRIEGFLITGCPGSAIELIEVTDALITDGLFDGCTGALVVASNVRPVRRPHLRGLRVRNQVGTGNISIPSASDALIEACDLESTFINNSLAPRTRIWNTRVNTSEQYAVFNAGGAGGGASMDIKGGYFESAASPIFMDPGCAGSSVTGATLRSRGTSGPWVVAPAASVAASGNVLVTSAGVSSIGTGQ